MRTAIPLVALAVGLSGCPTNPEDIDPPGEILQSNVDRDLDPDISQAKVDQLAADNRAFTFDLYHQLASGNDDNLFFSPYSASVALTMTMAGAEGNTATEMADALRLTLPEPDVHLAFDAIDLALATRGELPDDVEGTAPELHVVNQTFGQTGYPFEAAFLEILGLYYGAGMALLDFEADPDGSRELINEWVEQVTRERIIDLLPQGAISAYTKLVLVNAIYFKASWAEPFEKGDTTDDAFTLADGTEITTATMHGWMEGRYASGDGWELVDLPYIGNQLSLTVIVPEEGRFADIEAGLDVGFYDAAVAAATGYDIDLALPKFSFRTSANLIPPLQAMGMNDAFDSSAADFSGMSTASDLYISGVFHQAFVDVNEEGTEAAAATAVVVSDTSAPEQVAVAIDRPFIVVLRDRPTGEILFAGRVTDPR